MNSDFGQSRSLPRGASPSGLLGYASAPKAPGSADRSCPLEQTLARIPALRAAAGITRVAETTRLQRIDVPTFSAIAPDLQHIGVLSGKGVTREAALVGAVMEAVERRAAEQHVRVDRHVSLDELGVLYDVPALGLRPDAAQTPVPCTLGIDVIGGERLAVPLELVAFPWSGTARFQSHSTNGLASGNDLLEAAHHAAFELVERHLWSLVLVRSRITRPRGGVDAPDRAIALEVRQPTGDAVLDDFCARVRKAGAFVRLFVHREGDLPIGGFAVLHEPGSRGDLHGGYGCSWAPGHALTRALTEAISSRAVDIQGAREDFVRGGEGPEDSGLQFRGSSYPAGRWYADVPATAVSFDELADRSEPDLAREFDRLVSALVALGIRRCVVVELAHRVPGATVVRVFVPELERTIVDGSLGRLALASLFPLPFPMR